MNFAFDSHKVIKSRWLILIPDEYPELQQIIDCPINIYSCSDAGFATISKLDTAFTVILLEYLD